MTIMICEEERNTVVIFPGVQVKTHFPRQQEADRCSRVKLTLGHYLQRHGGANGLCSAPPLWRNLSEGEEFELKVVNKISDMEEVQRRRRGDTQSILNQTLHGLTDNLQLMG